MRKSYREEYPLQQFTVVVGILLGVEPQLMVFIVVLGEIKQDGRCFKHREIVTGVVDYYRDSSVWIYFDEPILLYSSQS